MTSSVHTSSLRQTFVLAREARQRGDHPFGSILLFEDNTMMEASNTVITESNALRHAEMNVINAAFAAKRDLAQAIIYCSTEPCAMCAAAIFRSGIRKVVFGCSVDRLASFTGGAFTVPSRHIFSFGKPDTEVIGPLLEDESAQVHQRFWPSPPK